MTCKLLRISLSCRFPLLIGSFCLLSQWARSQWTTPNSSNNIYNTNTNGFVGINVTTPLNALHVNGHVAATSYNSGGTLTGFVQSWADNAIIWKSGNENSGLRFGSATGLGADNWSEKMRISDAGNLGIGQWNPDHKLDVLTNTVNDGMRMQYNGPNGTGYILLQPNDFGQSSYNLITQAGDAGIIFGDAVNPGPSTSFGFVISPWQNAVSGLRVDKTGNVGICTIDTKGYQLAVNGSAIFTKVVVKPNNTWPDYVFKKQYSLPSLDSVEKYLEANSHLPGMPSADSVNATGIDLGNNQMALLKKIEELTLYIIGQNKQLQEQKKEIGALQQQNRELDAIRERIQGLETRIGK